MHRADRRRPKRPSGCIFSCRFSPPSWFPMIGRERMFPRSGKGPGSVRDGTPGIAHDFSTRERRQKSRAEETTSRRISRYSGPCRSGFPLGMSLRKRRSVAGVATASHQRRKRSRRLNTRRRRVRARGGVSRQTQREIRGPNKVIGGNFTDQALRRQACQRGAPRGKNGVEHRTMRRDGWCQSQSPGVRRRGGSNVRNNPNRTLARVPLAPPRRP